MCQGKGILTSLPGESFAEADSNEAVSASSNLRWAKGETQRAPVQSSVLAIMLSVFLRGQRAAARWSPAHLG